MVIVSRSWNVFPCHTWLMTPFNRHRPGSLVGTWTLPTSTSTTLSPAALAGRIADRISADAKHAAYRHGKLPRYGMGEYTVPPLAKTAGLLTSRNAGKSLFLGIDDPEMQLFQLLG